MRSAIHCAESLASESWSHASSMVCGIVSMSWIVEEGERGEGREMGRRGVREKEKEEREQRGEEKRGEGREIEESGKEEGEKKEGGGGEKGYAHNNPLGTIYSPASIRLKHLDGSITIVAKLKSSKNRGAWVNQG